MRRARECSRVLGHERRVTGLAGGSLGSFWANVLFDAIELRPKPGAQLCDQVSDLPAEGDAATPREASAQRVE
jgi:hypothetical protein